MERFHTDALQVAAHEAQQGHGALAYEIRDLVDWVRCGNSGSVLIDFPPELQDLAHTNSTAPSFKRGDVCTAYGPITDHDASCREPVMERMILQVDDACFL